MSWNIDLTEEQREIFSCDEGDEEYEYYCIQILDYLQVWQNNQVVTTTTTSYYSACKGGTITYNYNGYNLSQGFTPKYNIPTPPKRLKYPKSSCKKECKCAEELREGIEYQKNFKNRDKNRHKQNKSNILEQYKKKHKNTNKSTNKSKECRYGKGWNPKQLDSRKKQYTLGLKLIKSIKNCKYGQIVQLLKSDVNLHSCDSDSGQTPLTAAAKINFGPLVSFLLERGCDPNDHSVKGNYPLHYAVAHSNEKVVRQLLWCGADPNVKDPDGNTPLNLAAINSEVEIFKQILEYNPDLSIKNYEKELVFSNCDFDSQMDEEQEIAAHLIKYIAVQDIDIETFVN